MERNELSDEEEVKHPSKGDEPRKDFSGLIAKIKNYLLEYYEPVQSAKDADFHYSTQEIYRQLQKIVCNELLYSASDVALWLHNAGFTFEDFGELRFEWLMKRKTN